MPARWRWPMPILCTNAGLMNYGGLLAARLGMPLVLVNGDMVDEYGQRICCRASNGHSFT